MNQRQFQALHDIFVFVDKIDTIQEYKLEIEGKDCNASVTLKILFKEYSSEWITYNAQATADNQEKALENAFIILGKKVFDHAYSVFWADRKEQA